MPKNTKTNDHSPMPIQQLSTFLNLKPSQCVSIMGAGGKSTLMNRLADELIVLGRTVVLSSTTNYHRPKTLQSDQILLTRETPDWPDKLEASARRWNRLLVLHHDLAEALVHRPERVSELTGVQLGDLITPQAVAMVLTHPDTYASKIPSGARRV